jgi:hypothetical protein
MRWHHSYTDTGIDHWVNCVEKKLDSFGFSIFQVQDKVTVFVKITVLYASIDVPIRMVIIQVEYVVHIIILIGEDHTANLP